MGAGSAALRTHYDDILGTLGWSYSNSTGSDPSSGGGGPQSVNHVYQHDTGTVRLGEINASTNPLFVWADEDINFRDGPDVPGYQFDVSLDAQPNFIPVPMLEALFRQVPVAPGARLIDVSLESRDRPESSFDADLGLRYFDLEYVCELLPNSARAAHEVYSVGLEGSIYRAAEASFFDPGFFEFVEPTIDGDSWTQDVVVLDRYPGEITVGVDPATGAVQSTVSIRLEPNRPVLEELLES
jgi:hypothetical protein